MQDYANKRALIAEIEKTASLFIDEFSNIKEEEKDRLIEGDDRTPAQMIAYQLGWFQHKHYTETFQAGIMVGIIDSLIYRCYNTSCIFIILFVNCLRF